MRNTTIKDISRKTKKYVFNIFNILKIYISKMEELKGEIMAL